MNLRLLSLVFAPFAFGTSAFVFVGLLDPMANDLGVSVPITGQLQTVFALACGVGGPILARVLSKFDRKRVLVAVMAMLVIMNIASALAPQFGAIAAIRLIGGLFAALSIPYATTIAVSLVPEVKRPDAIATVLAGYTIAFLVGIPMGTYLGEFYDWRAAFWFAAVIAFIAVIIIATLTPRDAAAPQASAQQGSEAQSTEISFRAALTGENIRLITLSLLGFFATFMTIAYIGPVITQTTGLEGKAIGGVQIATGLGSILGLPAGAYLGRMPVRRALFIILSIVGVTQALFSVGMLFNLGWGALPLLIAAMMIGSAALFATLPVIQTRLATTAGAAATIAFALNSSMAYFGQGLGATLGGVITAWVGLAWVGVVGAAITVLALMIVSRLKAS